MFYCILNNRVKVAIDKLVPCYQDGCFRSEEDVDLNKLGLDG